MRRAIPRVRREVERGQPRLIRGGAQPRQGDGLSGGRALREVGLARHRCEEPLEVITAVVLITAEKGALPKLGEALAAIEGVSEVYSVTGDFDFVAMVRAREHDELADIVTRRIAQVSGVARTQTHVAFKAYSRHDLEALFAIGAEERRVGKECRSRWSPYH